MRERQMMEINTDTIWRQTQQKHKMEADSTQKQDERDADDGGRLNTETR